ncbi:MAG: ComF family protein [Proteobacteria bacterium]|nr:MAG: ComF family protein [Pseudomonadota bacterium]
MNRCVICQCSAKKLLCTGCQTLIKAPQAGCRCCAKPLPKLSDCNNSRLCADCRKRLPVFDQIFCAGVYQSPGSNWVLALKFSGHLHWARAMAELMTPCLADVPLDWPLVAIPLHRKRLLKRGYNQAHEIARLLAQFSGRQALSDVIIRRKDTAMQATLPEKKRQANVRNAFAVVDRDLPPVVILVDDVLTTGQTLSAAAAVLKKAGVQQVYGVVFLRSDS